MVVVVVVNTFKPSAWEWSLAHSLSIKTSQAPDTTQSLRPAWAARALSLKQKSFLVKNQEVMEPTAPQKQGWQMLGLSLERDPECPWCSAQWHTYLCTVRAETGSRLHQST